MRVTLTTLTARYYVNGERGLYERYYQQQGFPAKWRRASHDACRQAHIRGPNG
jgi:hypothetical protein